MDVLVEDEPESVPMTPPARARVLPLTKTGPRRPARGRDAARCASAGRSPRFVAWRLVRCMAGCHRAALLTCVALALLRGASLEGTAS